MQPEFKIFGEEQLLKEMKINIYSIDGNHEKITTALYNGTKYKVQLESPDTYIFYFSYKDYLVRKI